LALRAIEIRPRNQQSVKNVSTVLTEEWVVVKIREEGPENVFSAQWNSGLRQNNSLIAIVDDDPAVREATKALGRSLGYGASTFASADEFLKSDQVHDTSCLIADVHMPVMSGIELQDWLIARGHCIPIIFITANPDENVRIRALKAGALGFLSKPFDDDHLLRHLDKALKAS
jgi:FixJ family two-component response regulator